MQGVDAGNDGISLVATSIEKHLSIPGTVYQALRPVPMGTSRTWKLNVKKSVRNAQIIDFFNIPTAAIRDYSINILQLR